MLSRLRVVRLGPEWKAWLEQEVGRSTFVAWIALSEVGVIVVVGAFVTLITDEVPFTFAAVWLVVRWGMLAIPAQREATREAVLGHHRRKWERRAS